MINNLSVITLMSNYQISFWIRFPSRRCDPNNVCLAYKPTERRLLNQTKKVPTHQKILMELMVYFWTSQVNFTSNHTDMQDTFNRCSDVFQLFFDVRCLNGFYCSLDSSCSDCSVKKTEPQTVWVRLFGLNSPSSRTANIDYSLSPLSTCRCIFNLEQV